MYCVDLKFLYHILSSDHMIMNSTINYHDKLNQPEMSPCLNCFSSCTFYVKGRKNSVLLYFLQVIFLDTNYFRTKCLKLHCVQFS